MEIFFWESLMKSHSIWEFPVFWLVDTVVTWPKMRLWEISGLFETFGSDGSLHDTLKVSNRHNLKIFESLFETYVIWNLCYLNMQLIWSLDFTEVTCVWRHYLKLFDSLLESFVVWNFFYLKLFLFEIFYGNFLHLHVNEPFWFFIWNFS